MLTTNQIRKLMGKDNTDKVTKAKYEYLAIKKLDATIRDLGQAFIVLDYRLVPKHKLMKYFEDLHVELLLKTSIRLMKVLEFKKIRSIDGVNQFVFREVDGHLKAVPPTKSDLKRAKMLFEHLFELEKFVVELPKNIQDQIYARPGYGVEDMAEWQMWHRLEEEKAKNPVPALNGDNSKENEPKK